jgi:hypothetical protein
VKILGFVDFLARVESFSGFLTSIFLVVAGTFFAVVVAGLVFCSCPFFGDSRDL